MAYSISKVSPSDMRALRQVDALLEQEGIQRDGNLDYIAALYDEDYRVIATGSCFGNTLRCFAVSHEHQGEGLLNQVITHLIEVQHERGNLQLFLYTKIGSAKFFGDLGFYEIARVDGTLVFMENRRDGFSRYLKRLEKTRTEGTSAALVMNANPFTLGHQYLAETAAAQCDTLHLFIVSEDQSLVPFSVRKELIKAGTAHLPNLEIFKKIAAALNVTARFVGEEPTSQVTGLYNRIMAEELPKAGIACRIIPRKAVGDQIISASTVRKALQEGDMETFRRLVPATTAAWFESPEAAPVLERIRRADEVVHY